MILDLQYWCRSWQFHSSCCPWR